MRRRTASLTSVDLPDELRERLQCLNADLLINQVAPDSAVRAACDLLMAGVETPSVLELAGESPTHLRLPDAVALLRRVLTELGVGWVDPTQAPWVVARDVARQMIAGGLLPEDGASALWSLWWDCDNVEEIGLMLEPLEHWQEALPKDREDETIRARMRLLALDVIRVADARLAVNETGGGQ